MYVDDFERPNTTVVSFKNSKVFRKLLYAKITITQIKYKIRLNKTH
ncbi:hypothetical protein SAMN06264346_101215 [Chryseobacterium profundimaris]|uniref:Uncharacterized protein n=1 Tax=Chryseobacterium profundimaris TaxID=1387275 RepID=A0ABY1N8X1_9FLAO|nr:hypothetical protein SAMN06264346_101215 [Chryseobacterium profundimaris]